MENYEQFQDFFNCPLELTFNKSDIKSCWAKEKHLNENIEVDGIIPAILKSASQEFNFDLFINYKQLNEVDAYILMSRFSEQSFWMRSTATFSMDKEVIVTTPGIQTIT